MPSDVHEAFRRADDRRTAEGERRLVAEHEAFLRLPEAERQAIILAQQQRSEELWRLIEAANLQEQEPPPPMVMPEFVCSFCDRPRHEVAKLISGPRVFICDSCVAEAGGAMAHLLRA